MQVFFETEVSIYIDFLITTLINIVEVMSCFRFKQVISAYSGLGSGRVRINSLVKLFFRLYSGKDTFYIYKGQIIVHVWVAHPRLNFL